MAGADPDITTAEPSDFRRIKPSQEWYEKYIGQERYIPFLYGLLGVKTRLQDVKLTFVDQLNDHIRVNPVESWHWWMFWMGKVGHNGGFM